MYNLTMAHKKIGEKRQEDALEELITTEELIERAKESGVNFGHGEPYNRLRYYTKMGWIPHMIRKGKDVKGHYPEWVINRLKTIETLRKQRLSKEQITIEIQKTERKHNFKNKFLNKKNLQLIALILLGVTILLLISNEIGIFKIGKNRQDLIPLPQQIIRVFP